MNSKQQLAYLRFVIAKLSGSFSDAEIARRLGVERRRVQKIRQRMGLSKGLDALYAPESDESGAT